MFSTIYMYIDFTIYIYSAITITIIIIKRSTIYMHSTINIK